MRIIVSPTHDPYFNLAAEEYLLRNYKEEVLYLYVNQPTVVVGKHQNLLSEINYRFVVEQDIALARRITGGGAVFHDQGNLNYAFFAAAETGAQINFPKYLNRVIQVLQRLGINAVFEGKNNLRTEGYKISGNAGHVFKTIALHHGTLLINANLQMLSACLKTEEGRYTDRAVKSVRAHVTNLSQFNPDITIETLIRTFCEIIQSEANTFSAPETAAIEQLADEKFRSWNWIWGYSPPYTFERSATPWGKLKLSVEKGLIVDASIEYNPRWQDQLLGMPHDYPSLSIFAQRQGLPPEEIWWFF